MQTTKNQAKAQYTAILQPVELECALAWCVWLRMFAGTECESVLGGGRPSDSPGPAVCPRLWATAERSGRTLTHLCGQPTHSDRQEPAGTHTHTVKDGCLGVNISFGVKRLILRMPSLSFLSDRRLFVTKGTEFCLGALNFFLTSCPRAGHCSHRCWHNGGIAASGLTSAWWSLTLSY